MANDQIARSAKLYPRNFDWHDPGCLQDAPRSGRPRAAPVLTNKRIEQEVRRQLIAAGAESEKLRQYYSGAGAVAGLRMDMLREKALERLAALATHRDEFIEESRVAVSD